MENSEQVEGPVAWADIFVLGNKSISKVNSIALNIVFLTHENIKAYFPIFDYHG